MIQANCRTQLTSNDLRFLIETLARKATDVASLESLMRDPSALDELLDSDRVLDAILNHRGCLSISPYLYFYVIARRILRNAGIQERAVADYLGAMLAEFSQAERLHRLTSRPDRQFEYISDLLAIISEARAEETFVVRAHIGNYTLFVTGVFPQHLQHRARYKGAPDMEFYEGLGSTNFRLLSDHSIARKKHLDEVFNCLGQQFHEIRLRLNDMADRLLHLDGGDASVEQSLQLLTSGTP
jgi:hypothetical protein